MESAFGKEELATYCKIAAFKYLWRLEHKNGLEDAKKAAWYVNKFIDLMESGNGEKHGAVLQEDSPIHCSKCKYFDDMYDSWCQKNCRGGMTNPPDDMPWAYKPNE